MAGDLPSRHVPLLALLLSAALAAVSPSCPRKQGSCGFERAATGRLPSMDPDVTLHDVRSHGECASLCLDLLGARCQALSHHQEKQECRVYNNSQAMVHMVYDPGYLVFTSSCAHLPRFCSELEVDGVAASGVYGFDLRDGGPPFTAFCDMTTDGGNWTVFQRRQDGSVEFSLNWTDYQQGFGSPEGEHWLGNELLHRLSAAGLRELRVDLGDWDGNTSFAHYDHFSVGDAASNYTVTISGYNGTAGNAMGTNDGMQFSTTDVDNDGAKERHCAHTRRGGWWYSGCGAASLNSQYGQAGDSGWKVVLWQHWRGKNSLFFTEMKLR